MCGLPELTCRRPTGLCPGDGRTRDRAASNANGAAKRLCAAHVALLHRFFGGVCWCVGRVCGGVDVLYGDGVVDLERELGPSPRRGFAVQPTNSPRTRET